MSTEAPRIRLVELFAGIGAQRMAMIQGGIPHEVVGISEVDRHALRSYEAIYGDCPNLGDITEVADIPDADVVVYSFPCQSLSVAGRREGMAEGSGTSSSLVWEVARLLRRKAESGRLPGWLLMENVPAVLWESNRDQFRSWMAFLESLGYASRYAVLNAKDFGVPQNRARAFVLSHLGAVPRLPEGRGSGVVLGDVLEDGVPDRYVHPTARFVPKATGDHADVDRHPDGCLRVGTAEGINGHDILRAVYSPRGLGPTVVANSGGNTMPKIPHGDGRVRRLTPRECWRLQGFPDWAFDRARDAGTSDSQLYRQAGNSIAVPVLTELFRTVYRSMGEDRVPRGDLRAHGPIVETLWKSKAGEQK